MTDLRHATLLLGLAVTAAVTLASRLGWLHALERESIDARFELAPRPARPMTDAIVHVDIDDGALDSVGRWPWDRSVLADAVDELARAGARTIALDLVLSDPQALQHLPARDEPIDHDRLLAQSIARVPCVLAVKVHQTALGAAWTSTEGRGELDRLLAALGHGVDADAEAVADEVGLTGPRRRRFLDRPLAMKELAAWQTLRGLDAVEGPTLTMRRFLETVAPGVDANTGNFAEKPMLERLWAQRESWHSLARHLAMGR